MQTTLLTQYHYTMNKLFYLASAAVLSLGMVSCSSEEDLAISQGGNVNFSIQLPAEMATRAYSDGTTASTLHYYVYDEDGTDPVYIEGISNATGMANAFDGELKANVSLNLATGKTYSIVFWADAPGNAYYTYDTATKGMTVTYAAGALAQDESRDAFFAYEAPFRVEGAINKNVTLKRPFAQINVGTTDMQAAKDSRLDVKKTSMTVKGVYTGFNLATGAVTGDATDVTLALADIPTEAFPYKKPADDTSTYTYLGMNYVLVNEKTTVDVVFGDDNAKTDDLTFTAVPVQRNYRTNIFGSLLTDPANYTVRIDKEWSGDDYNYLAPVKVNSNEELAAAIQNGGSYIIPEDKALTMPDITKSIELSQPLKLQVDGTMSLTSGEDPDKYSNLTLFNVKSNVEIIGSGTIEANGGDFMFSCRKEGSLNIDGVDIIYNCQEKASNRAAISVNYATEEVDNPVTIKNSTITTNCTAIGHNNKSKVTIENTTINVNLRSDGGNMWEAIRSKGNISLTNVKINSKARALEISQVDSPFDAILKDCEFYAEADRVLYVSSSTVEGSKLTIDGGKFSCKNTTGTEYKAPIVFDSNRSGKKFDCNIISGEFVKQPWGFQGGTWPNWTDDDPSVYLAPGSKWEEITPAATNPVYTWRVVKE